MTEARKISIAANLIGLVAPFIGRGNIRYYLDGISVRPAIGGGAIIAATNGHALAMVLDRSAVCEEEVILRVNGHLLQACAAEPFKNKRRLELINDRLTVAMGEGKDSDIYIQAGNPFIEAKYPDIFKVVPNPEELQIGMAGAFNPAVVDKVTQAARVAAKIKGGGLFRPMQFWTPNSDASSPCVVRLEGVEEWFAVLMPARCDVPKTAAPEFVVAHLKAREF